MTMADLREHCHFVARPSVVARPIGDDLVLLDLDSGLYYSLNETAACIWRGLEQGQPPNVTAALLQQQYEISDADARRDVTSLVESLLSMNLIAPQS